jgi:two-component system response regulator AtoC
VQEGASLVLHCPDRARVAQLQSGKPLMVGREFPAEIEIPDASLSRQHARFLWNGDEFSVEDLDSTNGTHVGGRRIKSATVRVGEPIQLGGVTAAFYRMSADGTADEAARECHGLVVKNQHMIELYQLVDRIAKADVQVLVLGETGCGKERIAQAIYSRSKRSKGTFRAINCAAIPTTLAESLLFGHEKGAFTGAHTACAGVFEQANGGVVLLDEIGDLSYVTQGALLRVLEAQKISRLGSTRETAIDVRVIAATHRDLPAMVAAGTFRADLLYRLNTVTLRVPPLRERKEEIAPLADRFLRQAARSWERSVIGFTQAALALLEDYDWPGNIRQLRNAIEHAVLVSNSELVGVDDLPLEVTNQATMAFAGSAVVLGAHPPTPSPVELDPSRSPATALPSTPEFSDRVRTYEIEMILAGMQQTGGNQSAAAKLLRIPLRTLSKKVKLYDIRGRLAKLVK